MAIRSILLLGAGGQLGQELYCTLRHFTDVVACTHHEADFTKPDQVREVVKRARPAIVVNAAAYTNVDEAETRSDLAHVVNGFTVEILGELAKSERFGLVHFSTDYVFDGKKSDTTGSALLYTEEDATAPVNEYGHSKRRGKEFLVELGAPAIILRTSWLYSNRRPCLLTHVLTMARKMETFQMVSDQVGSPTFARDLAEAVALMLYGMQLDPLEMFDRTRGIYHLASTGATSRAGFATSALQLDPRQHEHRAKTILSVATRERDGQRRARRPLRTPLDSTKFRRTFGIELPHWHDALTRALLTS